MALTFEIIPSRLLFRSPAGTSRGVYTERFTTYVLIRDNEDPSRWGIGECAPLPRLSCDDLPNYADLLRAATAQLQQSESLDYEALRPYPSILFGLESALQHLKSGSFALWNTSFARGEAGIPINGLIWMGDYRSMREQISVKLNSGFRCLKLKIGAIDFDDELRLLQQIRNEFSAAEVTLRVDANGAFSPNEALEKLDRLSRYQLHSIEQPIAAGQPEALAQLCRETPLPIALDEELIVPRTSVQKRGLLESVKPHYIILKPSLHGGIAGCQEWIEAAKGLDIGWWITSALESNIGLNAIAHWCATLAPITHQGLGTGALFTDNLPLPLSIQGEQLFYTYNSPEQMLHAPVLKAIKRLCINAK